MENLQNNAAEILILLLLVITFLQSGLDKITDWKGNISWLREHFAKTFMKDMVPQSVAIVLVLEIITGMLCLLGIIRLLIDGDRLTGLYGSILSCLTLLILLFGQRVAKDYEGARTIVVYFIPAVLGVLLLQ
ncbi:DoxX family protein [Sinomicrobium weinanense]|uniref:DoxX family protein n=1 Tax=Sinomicrobium weinanense TaxID=2842200 RepID=A0A926Q4V3_9FLAO|nr:DoxX family protein [Sinomicrobium weinanense]MBC9797290.1 DoxX family protein [Sinomicrobium weinanense]MBU3125423.1 DoxX family protein [Sinomicrobium weinanense]